MDDENPEPLGVLRSAHLKLTMQQTEDLLRADWDEPSVVSMHEKRARIITAHRSNIEKIVVDRNDQHLVSEAQLELDAKEFERRLLRLAHSLGRDRGVDHERADEEGAVGSADTVAGVGEG